MKHSATEESRPAGRHARVHPAGAEDSLRAGGHGQQAATGSQLLPVRQQPRADDGRELSLSGSEVSAQAKRSAKHHKKWNRRLKIFFCCLGYKKNKESIADVASIFAEFYSDLNAPSSDIAAGFVLLSKYQAAQRDWILKNESEQQARGIDQYLSGIPIKQDTKFLDISTAEDSHLVNDLIYYMNYSLAIFGWPLHIVDDPCLLCCICPYLRLSPCCQPFSRRKVGSDDCGDAGKTQDSERAKAADRAATSPTGDKKRARRAAEAESLPRPTEGPMPTIPGQLDPDCHLPIILQDNCCSCNAASAERRLARHNYEIVYVSYKSSVNVVPFLVAADHSKRTIVVAIRGSMNLADMVTDLNGTVDPVPIRNCPDDWLCHRGITNAAVYVKSTLLERRILERAFNCRPDIGSQEYNLVICGHSLGAGAAAILGILLREHYPSLRAYLYSPPGGMLSMPVVEYTKQFAIGIILGNDTVARLGVAQLERLRYHSLLSLKSAQKSPGKILARALCPSFCCGSNHVDYDPEQSLDLLHGTSGRSFDYNNTKIPFQVQPQVLYVPGRLIHVVKNYSFRTKTQRLWSGPIYQAVWTDNAVYDRIMISEGMFLDHLPHNLMHAMKMLFSRTLPDRRDSRLPSSASAVKVPVESLSGPALRADTEQASRHMHERALDADRASLRQDQRDACDTEDKEESQMARAKNVIEDDNNNNNNNNDDEDHNTHSNSNESNNNNDDSEDLNNNSDAKLYPNLNSARSRSSLNDIKRCSLNGSVSSDSNQDSAQQP